MKILMVCLGNICRSPLAEGIMRHKARAAGLHWEIDSAGTGSWHVGEPPHRLSQKTALYYGVDISSQRGRQFHASDMERFDVIFFMEDSNRRDAKAMARHTWNDAKAHLLLNEITPGANEPVPDPYYGTEEDYHHVFRLISTACDAFIARQMNV
jgi:protein-tyrosine phosphatase